MEGDILKTVSVKWNGKMGFVGHPDSGHEVLMDARAEGGGEDRGPRPSELVLVGLGGCTGMDVVSILGKMRIPITDFRVDIEADSATEHPKSFTDIRLVYRVWGDVSPDKFLRAVELSWGTYCSVANLLKKGAKMSYRCEINGEPVQ